METGERCQIWFSYTFLLLFFLAAFVNIAEYIPFHSFIHQMIISTTKGKIHGEKCKDCAAFRELAFCLGE